jgi:ABC-type transport system substrate-binding protein
MPALDMFRGAVMDDPVIQARLKKVGILTKQQKLQMATSGPLGKAMGAMVPLTTMYLVGSGMVNGNDPYEIMQNQLMAASGFTGGIAGMRLGGVMSPVSANGYIRGASRLAGFATGAAVAAGLAYGVTESIRDLTSADSKLGALMYDAPKRELLANYEQTQGTLTMRGRALQQMNSSALNDRGFTLGNEASILKNVSL